MPLPRKDGEPKLYSEKIRNIVTDISTLTLAEVSDLNTLLKVLPTLFYHWLKRFPPLKPHYGHLINFYGKCEQKFSFAHPR